MASDLSSPIVHPWVAEGQSRIRFGIQVQDAKVFPPVQQPYVPLLIAGGGERDTLRQVAQHADMSNFGPNPVTGGAATTDDVVRKLRALEQHWAAAGRPYDSVLRSHYLAVLLAPTSAAVEVKMQSSAGDFGPLMRPSMFTGTPSELVSYYRSQIDAGMRYFNVAIGVRDPETLTLIGEQVIPELAAA